MTRPYPSFLYHDRGWRPNLYGGHDPYPRTRIIQIYNIEPNKVEYQVFMRDRPSFHGASPVWISRATFLQFFERAMREDATFQQKLAERKGGLK